MTKLSGIRCLARLAFAFALVAAPQAAEADRTVAVLFTGFGATPGSAGMDDLSATLASVLGGKPAQPFSSQVFAYFEQQEAFDFVDGFADMGCLVLIGHSFGADSAIELVTDFLTPAGIVADLLIQLDSVGIDDEVLPPGVIEGLNYYQISTGLFEPQGEAFVAGSTNYQVEALYGVTNADITHTRIDCALFDYTQIAYALLFGSQPDLYSRIVDHITVACALAVPALGRLGVAFLLLTVLATLHRIAPRSVPGGSTPGARQIGEVQT